METAELYLYAAVDVSPVGVLLLLHVLSDEDGSRTLLGNVSLQHVRPDRWSGDRRGGLPDTRGTSRKHVFEGDDISGFCVSESDVHDSHFLCPAGTDSLAGDDHVVFLRRGIHRWRLGDTSRSSGLSTEFLFVLRKGYSGSHQAWWSAHESTGEEVRGQAGSLYS